MGVIKCIENRVAFLGVQSPSLQLMQVAEAADPLKALICKNEALAIYSVLFFSLEIFGQTSFERQQSFDCMDLSAQCRATAPSNALSGVYEIASQSCLAEQIENNCSDLAQRPGLEKKVRDCSPRALCLESQATTLLSLKGCFWDAPGAYGQDISDEIAAGANRTMRSLAKFPQNLQYVNPMMLVFFRAGEVLKVPGLITAKDGPRFIQAEAVRWLSDKKIKLQCFNREARAELLCYGALSVFAPGAAFKVAQRVPQVINALKLSPALKIESEAGKVLDSGSSSQLSRLERRNSASPTLSSSLQRVGQLDYPGTSAGLKVFTNRAVNGEPLLTYEYAVKVPGKGWMRKVAELPVDPLTGAIDANIPAGRKFLELMVQENSGRSVMAFLDVGSLRYVNTQFKAGRVAGDAYLQRVAEAIQSVKPEQISLVKLGGDEFAIFILEKDPVLARNLLQEISSRIHSKEVHEIFRQEKIERARAFRTSPEPRDRRIEEFRNFLPYSRASASIGSTEISGSDTLATVLSRAEGQATQSKIEMKIRLNQDASKYGGPKAHPLGRTDQVFKPTVAQPIGGADPTAVGSPLFKVEDSMPVVQEIRHREVGRFDQFSLAEYIDETGEQSFKMEKYVATPSGDRRALIHDVALNSKTGFIDGNSLRGQEILATVAKERPQTGLLWIDARHLGEINYFLRGTQSGDAFLDAIGVSIKESLQKGNIGFKLKGSEFLVEMGPVGSQGFEGVKNRIADAIEKNPQVRSLFSQQRKHLEKELKRNPSSQDLKAQLKRLDSLKQVQMEATTTTSHDSLEAILQRTRGLHKAP